MNKVKIFTDSTCDLDKQVAKNRNISIIPLYVVFKGQNYKDGIDIKTEELYNKVEKLDELPKTSAPTPIDFYNSFKPYIDDGFDIVYIGLSSKISSTIQNAKLAANQLPENRVKIIDSLNLSGGIGFLVLKACDLLEQGLNASEIEKNITELVPKIRTSFIVDTLEYLHKGGRCSDMQSIIGSVLKIKPIVKVVDGNVVLGQKKRGKRKKIINHLLNSVYKTKNKINTDRIIVGHSMNPKDCEYIKNELKNKLDIKEIIDYNAGCIISSHCGKNTVSIIYSEK